MQKDNELKTGQTFSALCTIEAPSSPSLICPPSLKFVLKAPFFYIRKVMGLILDSLFHRINVFLITGISNMQVMITPVLKCLKWGSGYSLLSRVLTWTWWETVWQQVPESLADARGGCQGEQVQLLQRQWMLFWLHFSQEVSPGLRGPFLGHSAMLELGGEM